MAKEEKILTPEEKERKERLRFRILIVLIIFDVILAGYLIYEMISVFAGGNKSNNTTAATNIFIQLFEYIKLLK